MREIKSHKFIELIEKSEKIDQVTLTSLANKHNDDHSGLLLEIVEKGYMRKDIAGELWARAMGCTFVDPLSMTICCEEENQIPVDMAKRIKAIGLYEFDGYVTLAMEDPTNRQLIESLERFLQKRVSPVFAIPDDIDVAIEQHFQTEQSFDEALRQLENATQDFSEDTNDKDAMLKLVESNALVDLTNRIFYAAFKQNASDIHIEAHKEFGIIRFRVDGQLRELARIPKKVHTTVIVRIKFVCELDISDTRLPQDGRFAMDIGPFEQNFRVSTLPGLNGEKAVIRLLGSAGDKNLPTFEDMLFCKSNLKRLRNAVAKPNGIFIVTGPTGSGKTTTLYSCLDYLNDPESNIMTIEDPVEYQLEGINHFEVKHKVGLDFKRVLRAALRQDPDIILVGEIRDTETAKIAVEAALTGHMVLSTLHTNNALQAVMRLVEIGVDPYMVSPALNGVMSQRLARRICDSCKEAYIPKQEVLEKYFLPGTILKDHMFHRGKGCGKCHKTGYKGRVALHEIVEISEEIRDHIANSSPLNEIHKAAKKVGYATLREDALKKALMGFTTLDEVERITLPEYVTY